MTVNNCSRMTTIGIVRTCAVRGYFLPKTQDEWCMLSKIEFWWGYLTAACTTLRQRTKQKHLSIARSRDYHYWKCQVNDTRLLMVRSYVYNPTRCWIVHYLSCEVQSIIESSLEVVYTQSHFLDVGQGASPRVGKSVPIFSLAMDHTRWCLPHLGPI